MQTGRIKLAKIPTEWVEQITRSTDEVSKMTVRVPNLIYTVEKELVDNPLYYNFRGKGQQIVIESEKNPNANERYIITNMSVEEECYELDDGEYRKYSVKEITAESYEAITKENRLVLNEDIVRCLYTSEETAEEDGEISEGMLNLFIKDNPLFKIGHVSEKCRKEYCKVEQVYTGTLVTDTTLKMDRKHETVLFDMPLSTTKEGNNIINLKINYARFKCYDEKNIMVKENYWQHELKNIYTNVENVKATYTTTEDIKYCVRYELTLDNGDILVRDVEVDYMDNLLTTFPKIDYEYTNGKMIERYSLKYCSFEVGTYNWYDFLMNDIASAYDCVFVFDSYNKILNCYDKSELGERKGIKLSYENFIKKINKTNRFDDIVTKLYVFSDNTSIIDENIFGACEYILNYDYFYNNDIMTDELKIAWDRYVANLDGHQVELMDLRSKKNDNNKTILLLESENIEMDYNIRLLQLRRTDYIKRNSKNEFDKEIADLTTDIERRQAIVAENLKNIQIAKDSNDFLNEQLTAITKQTDFSEAEDENGKIFTQELIEELSEITYTQEITDSKYLTSFALYNNYTEVLAEKNKLGIDFDIEVQGLLEQIIIPKGLTWDYYIGLWDIFEIEDEDINSDSDIENGLRLTGITYSPKNFTVTDFKFSNKNKNKDDYELASNIGREINRSNNYVVNYNNQWKDSMGMNAYYKELTTSGMDLKASMIKSRGGRVKLDFSEAGMYVIDAENEDNQAYIGASMYCITRDRWFTCATAIDENGIVGKEIVGQLILGKELYIVGDSGEFYIGETSERGDGKPENFGLLIKDENGKERFFAGIETDSDNIRRTKIRLLTADGKESVLDETGRIDTEQVVYGGNISSGYPLRIPYYIDDEIYEIKDAIITITVKKYRSYVRSLQSGGGDITSQDGGYYKSVFTSSDSSEGVQEASSFIFNTTTPVMESPNMDTHYHQFTMVADALPHTHSFSIYLPIEIPSHIHHIDTTHNHPIEYAIIEDNVSIGNIELYCNGQRVTSGIKNGDRLHLTNFLNMNSMNNIEVRCTTNCRVTCNLWVKSRRKW